MTGTESRAGGRWDDLGKRVASAVFMVGVGAFEIWVGGPPFAAFAVVLTGVMIWELAGLTAPWGKVSPSMLGLLALVSLGLVILKDESLALGLLLVPGIVFVLTERRDRMLAGAYCAMIMLAGYGLVGLRNETGPSAILWVIAVVVASDVLGYFAGRTLGGPKFWPQVSPKKTWSGTVAGWIGAALVGLGFVWLSGASWVLVPVSILVAFAGQMGDILESWVKRRAGVKDASRLIPGHGGLLDRFDALIGAIVVVKILGLVLPVVPLLGG